MAWGTMVRCSSCGSWVPPDGLVVHWQLRHPGLGHPAIGAPEHLPEQLADDYFEGSDEAPAGCSTQSAGAGVVEGLDHSD